MAHQPGGKNQGEGSAIPKALSPKALPPCWNHEPTPTLALPRAAARLASEAGKTGSLGLGWPSCCAWPWGVKSRQIC